jgi:hypothetical protein
MKFVSFEVLTAVNLKITAILDVMQHTHQKQSSKMQLALTAE